MRNGLGKYKGLSRFLYKSLAKRETTNGQAMIDTSWISKDELKVTSNPLATGHLINHGNQGYFKSSNSNSN